MQKILKLTEINLCNYSNVFIVTSNLKVFGMPAVKRAQVEETKELIFKNCVPFTVFLSEINDTNERLCQKS